MLESSEKKRRIFNALIVSIFPVERSIGNITLVSNTELHSPVAYFFAHVCTYSFIIKFTSGIGSMVS